MAEESIPFANQRVAKADDFVSLLEIEYKKYEDECTERNERVKECDKRVKEFDDLVRSNVKNRRMLFLNKKERDKAQAERDKAQAERDKAQAERDKAHERLDKARQHLKDAQDRVNDAHERLDKMSTPRALDEMTPNFKLALLQTIREGLADLQVQGSSPQYSESTVAKMELERLDHEGCVVVEDGEEEGIPFLSRDQQNHVSQIEKETELIAYFTPLFDALLNSFEMVFVNSENYAWLPQSNDTIHNFKPDGFSTHRGMYVKEKEDSGRRFGKAVKELFDCIILFEGTLEKKNTSYWQVARYLTHLNPKGPASAILFDRTSFWMITSSCGQVNKIVKSRWVNEGSKTLFHDFIMNNKSSWIPRLQEACGFFNVVVKEGNAFLGRGAFGRVFRVFRDEKEFALKISERSFTYRLCHEWAALKNAERTNLTVKPEGPYFEFPSGAAILLSPVGRSFTKLTAKDIANLFVLLYKLHFQGLAHGDARVPNVILHQTELLWIDLVDVFDLSVQKSSHLLHDDIAKLTRSILGKSHNEDLNDELELLMQKYCEDVKEENFDAVTVTLSEICDNVMKSNKHITY